MTDDTPPLHPLEREQLRSETRLVVTVSSSREFHDDVVERIVALDRGGSGVDSTPTIAFESYDDLLGTLTPRVLDLIEVVRQDEPESIHGAARAVGRDVKNVHDELTKLAQLGIIFFEEDGQKKRPVVWFDELVINLPVGPETDDTAAAV